MENYKVDKKTKILIWLMFLLFVFSVILTYERTVMSRDYEIIENQE